MAKDPAARFPTAAALGQVARRTAAGLAGTGTPAPVSPGPVPAQTSPGPSGTPPVVATPRPPTTRGVAGYPAGGPAVAGTARPTASGGYRGSATPPVAPIPARPEPSYRSAPAPAPTSTGRAVLIGVLVGLFILLLIAAAVVAYRLASAHNSAAGRTDRGGASVTTSSPARSPHTPPAASGQATVAIDCGKLRGKQYTVVQRSLRDDGFEVVRADATGTNRPAGEVVDLNPCLAHKGETITVSVSLGRGDRSSPTPTATAKYPGCGIDLPIAQCASGLPSGPVGPSGN